MKIAGQYIKVLIGVLVILALGYGFVAFYPYIFAKTVVGKVEKIERIDLNVALMQNNAQDRMNSQLFSFAVAIQSSDGTIHTASTEDRQWAAVSPGVCVTAKFFPYPPWNLEKSGTFYGARVLETHVCQ
ncbi:MAG: hypothetical protein AB7F59_06960 [Bdellovibrionales bacterium]